MKYFIKTFGCQHNKADSEYMEAALKGRGMTKAKGYKDADYVVINTCMVRQSAENRVYGLVYNLSKFKLLNSKFKIIVTGCMVGLAFRDKSGQFLAKIRQAMPAVDEFLPIEEVGFDHQPIRQDAIHAWIPIANGCNNFCTFCVVPFTRGREVSRPYNDIIKEAKELKSKGYRMVTLLGQNVNSYGADLFMKKSAVGGASEEALRPHSASSYVGQGSSSSLPFRSPPLADKGGARRDHERQNLLHQKPIYVKHLGRYRIPTLFPYLLEDIAKLGFEKVDFISSNPWDFSDELINVIANNKNITRTIHLPVQSGDDNVLKRMNRWHTAAEYIQLISKIKYKILNIKFTTDIIVGFCGETDEEFQNTVKLAKEAGFEKAYIAMYSPRPMTAATKLMKDDVPHAVKKQRWQILENLINKPHLNIKDPNLQMHPNATNKIIAFQD